MGDWRTRNTTEHQTVSSPTVALRIIPSRKRNLGDKLQVLAGLAPRMLIAVETLVDHLLSNLPRAS